MAEPNAKLVSGSQLDPEMEKSRDIDDIGDRCCPSSANVRNKCLLHCKQFLGGIWCEVSPSDVKVDKIDGGVSNLMYRCLISPDIVPNRFGQTTEVAVKLYEPKNSILFDNDRMVLNDQIVSYVMSRNKIGPRILGLFPDGQILQFIKVIFNHSKRTI